MSCGDGCQGNCCDQEQKKREVLVEVSVVQYYPSGGVSPICHFGNVPLGSVRIDGRTIQFECQHKIHVFILADSVQVEITMTYRSGWSYITTTRCPVGTN